MFWDDRSASRGEMETVGLYAFRHSSPLGEAPAGRLFERIRVARRSMDAPPRSFSDYEVTVDDANLPGGVELLRIVG